MVKHLPSVTLVAIDTNHPKAAILAMQKSMKQLSFAKSILFTSEDVFHPGIEVHNINKFASVEDYSRFVFRGGIEKVIDTDFALFVHWDGWVVDGERWDDEFLKFDYIGAPWWWYEENKVGNGGFCLRSKRLLNELPLIESDSFHPEDGKICRDFRPHLESKGIKFADVDAAHRFAIECSENGPSMGFHGTFNIPRFTTKGKLLEIIDSLPMESLRGGEVSMILDKLKQLGRMEEFNEISSRKDKPKCFYHKNPAFGDSFNLFAAGSVHAKNTGKKVYCSCYDPFKGLARYFDGVEYVHWDRLGGFDAIDTGVDAGSLRYRYNAVSWNLRKMSGTDVATESDIRMNVARFPNPEFVSILLAGNTQGCVSPETLHKMLIRARIFYPKHTFQIVGHPYSTKAYDDLIAEFSVVNNQTNDTTCSVIMDQLRRSSLLMGVHTGPTFIGLGLGLQVWCQRSLHRDCDIILDFPSNRPYFFDKD